jgi:hypothetical protein
MAHVGTGPSGSTGDGGDTRRPLGSWALVAALLAVGILVPLLVFLYDTETPQLWGFPFYYWFQFAMIPVVSGLTFAAFRLSLRATSQDRPAFGLPPEPPADGAGPTEAEDR